LIDLIEAKSSITSPIQEAFKRRYISSFNELEIARFAGYKKLMKGVKEDLRSLYIDILHRDSR